MRCVVRHLLLLSMLAGPGTAHAFCGFYVASSDGPLYSDRTQVVLMRDGTRTVLSMQSAYRGPVEDFSVVIPVPVVLDQDSVKTLPPDVFERVDRLASPRLVEYWEQDPCANPAYGSIDDLLDQAVGGGGTMNAMMPRRRAAVRVEARFAVGEYQIVILAADESAALTTWLRSNGYSLPEGAAAVLRPYVARGMKFFVAKVDTERVTFRDGEAVLSPIRVHYDSPRFELPTRLGMLSSAGTQDLVVHVLARDQRYEVANRPNRTIATNHEVPDSTRQDFAAYHQRLLDDAFADTPDAAVTEYAWQAQGCDPCPGPVLSDEDLHTLGADTLTLPLGLVAVPRRIETRGALTRSEVFAALRPMRHEWQECARRLRADPGPELDVAWTVHPRGSAKDIRVIGVRYRDFSECIARLVGGRRHPTSAATTRVRMTLRVGRPRSASSDFVLTRLHLRSRVDGPADDLVFREAPPIVGGREGAPPGAELSSTNAFQARYVIRHRWEGPVECAHPVHGRWGARPRVFPASSSTSSATMRTGPPSAAPPKPALALATLPKSPAAIPGRTRDGTDETVGATVPVALALTWLTWLRSRRSRS